MAATPTPSGPTGQPFHEPRGQRGPTRPAGPGWENGWPLGPPDACLPLRPRHNRPQRGARGSPGVELSDHPRSTPPTSPAPRMRCQKARINKPITDERRRSPTASRTARVPLRGAYGKPPGVSCYEPCHGGWIMPLSVTRSTPTLLAGTPLNFGGIYTSPLSFSPLHFSVVGTLSPHSRPIDSARRHMHSYPTPTCASPRQLFLAETIPL